MHYPFNQRNDFPFFIRQQSFHPHHIQGIPMANIQSWGNPGMYQSNGNMYPYGNQWHVTNHIANEGFNLYQLIDDPLFPIYNNHGQTLSKIPLQGGFQPSPMYQPPRPTSTNSLLNSFKDKDGSMDFNKMFSTAGQLMGTLNQFSALLKGFSQLFKT